MSVINDIRKEIVDGYDLEGNQIDDLECAYGDKVVKDQSIILRMHNAELIIPVVADADRGIDVIKDYLSNTYPVGNDPMYFSVFQRSFFKITILNDVKSQYAIIIFNDKKSDYERALYLHWNKNRNEWVAAKPSLQVFEKIRIAYGRENIGSILIKQGGEFLVNPRVSHQDNTVEIPLPMRTHKEVRMVSVVSHEQYRLEVRVKRVAMIPVGGGEEKLVISDRNFVFTKNGNKPIRKSKVELDVPQAWIDSIKGELDFEQNPLNVGAHDLFETLEPKYAGANFYVTNSKKVWVKSQNSWIPVHQDYVDLYLSIEDIKQESDLYKLLT